MIKNCLPPFLQNGYYLCPNESRVSGTSKIAANNPFIFFFFSGADKCNLFRNAIARHVISSQKVELVIHCKSCSPNGLMYGASALLKVEYHPYYAYSAAKIFSEQPSIKHTVWSRTSAMKFLSSSDPRTLCPRLVIPILTSLIAKTGSALLVKRPQGFGETAF